MSKHVTYHKVNIITVDDFWSPEKCEEYITLSESLGYSQALVQTDMGPRRIADVRNNSRLFYDSESLAEDLWEDLKDIAPEKVGYSRAVGLNERFRFYKYEAGQAFRWHRDQSFVRNEVESSYYTFMIYLNDDFDGGATKFEDLTIEPKQGRCLLFFHPLRHEGERLVMGTKYILRTDVMYSLASQK